LHQSLTENEISNVSLYKAIENQANIFAGAFLLPAETFGNEYLTSNLDSYIAIKKKWNVSLGAMIIRARNLDVIDKQQLTYLFRQLSARGYRKHEPYDDEMKFEGPSIIYSSVKMIFDNKIVNMQDFIDAIALPKDELIAVCSFPDYFIEQHLTSPRNGPHLYVIDCKMKCAPHTG
jgi:Zn-dependent peptidase ImmA (M78 family)